MSELKLLNCPFCGGEAKIATYDWGYSVREYWCYCSSCECETKSYHSKEEAIKHWNTRTPMDNIVEKLEEKHIDISANTSLHYLYSEGYIDALDYVSDIVKKEINNGLE